ncbi:MAG TPA: NAD(P)/FAD-dependent oxidoreductase [Candidatus Lokiarchaeia archaeon]|nr:NAD(P)/FAD-dependent oxidoreductase [Candidatus Lokiarchaeia archaeon]
MSGEQFDACVVGAGPAGSIAAQRLAKEGGVSVLLLDAQKFPRYKCCAAGVLWHDIEDFPEIKPVIENFNYKLVAHSPSLVHEFSVQSGEHYLMGQTYRTILDTHLAGLAKDAGADFRDNTRVTGLELLDDRKGIKLTIHDNMSGSDSEVISRVVIGADGVKSIVRKSHPDFKPWKKADLLIASELDVPMNESAILETFGEEHAVHMYLYFHDLPGYAWIFTKKKSVSLGMGTMLEYNGKTYGGKMLAGAFKEYCNYLESTGMIPPDAIQLDRTSYALIPCTSLRQATTYGRNTLLAGDAAGAFVSALSGEGIYYSMLSGKYAAQIAATALKKNDLSPAMLGSYETVWKARLERELNYQYFAKRYMLESKRRCEKAVRWGMHDATIQRFMGVFFTGVYEIDRRFMARLYYHYMRLKIKDMLGRLGSRENKEDYKTLEVSMRRAWQM